MDILVITEQYWPEGGGGTLATHLTVDLLSQLGKMKITVLSGTKNRVKVDGVKYLFTPLLNASNKILLWKNLMLLAKNSCFLKLLTSADVLYIPRYCYPLIPLAKELGKKVVVHLHDYQLISYNAAVLCNSYVGDRFEAMKDTVKFELLEHQSIRRALLSAILAPVNRFCRSWVSMADKIVCVSNRQHEIIASFAPELANKLEVIHNPLPNISPSKKNLNNPTFLYLGGDSYVKGFHIFLKASWELLRRGSDASFLLTGGLRGASKSLLRRVGRPYKLFGHIDNEEVLSLHRTCHALLFPSISEEPLPYAVMESALAGTIPIASRVGGLPEIVEGTFAEKMLFEPGNVDECVDGIECLLAMSNEQIEDVGFGLREAVYEKFGLEVIRDKLVKAFSS